MKKISLTFLFITNVLCATAQWNTSGSHIYNVNTGNVGIGTGISPAYKLHIAGGDVLLKNSLNSSLHFRTDGNGDAFINNMNNFVGNESTGNGSLTITGQSMLRFKVGNTGNAGTEMIRITDQGRVGIGETNPSAIFQIGDRWTYHNGSESKIIGYNYKSDGGAKRIVSDEVSTVWFTSTGGIMFRVSPSGPADSEIDFTNALTIENDGDVVWANGSAVLRTDQGGSIDLGGSGTPYIDFSNDPSSDYDARLILRADDALELSSANLLIGKSSQSNTSYKIDVSGKIRSNEIVVNTDGADYVFQPGYQLRDLGELETFIRVNKHLPGIVSADEMQREGMSVAETTTKLLEKIEELTLYLIEIKKENNSQKEKINELANFIAALQNKQ